MNSLHKSQFHTAWSQQGRLPAASSSARVGFRRRLAASQASEATTTARVEAPSDCVLANFSVQGKVAFGEWLRLVGSSNEFGRWGPLEGPLLRWNEGDVWKASIQLPCDLNRLEFKVVVCHEKGGNPRWEPVPNRVLEVPNEPGILDHSCVWGSMDGSTSSFTPSYAVSQEHDPQESQAQPTMMAALPSWGTVEPAQPPPTSSHATQEEPPVQAAKPSPPAAPSAPSTSSQDSPSTSEPPSSQEGKFSLFGLVGPAAVSATALAAVLLALALGEASTIIDKQRKAAASPEPQEQALSKGKGAAAAATISSSLGKDVVAPAPAPPLRAVLAPSSTAYTPAAFSA
mmetsp:Transcript_3109/g.8210  ORF Transcript_3109/g.8210 Transcript_3109/m.8210 type:complete len:343 (-) Transcript_3109:1094-2122(-)|eukprot:CAMPEP_0202349680 /NCGR_PEP_ID=MMETSP1126-20121109/7072_1 /ASSEMBLY_ACC=CAM_ASM_000457 /TAXON_ID=3047 /ORGANISM="Dunaliella tertiolecta, Strain CCMP1320" /LENGTH=342 /DNA_ID=CAMNT_0048941533 /DNA_START=54 /DNA_END=1082 /DNA_ORIENTATION=-